MCKSLCEYESCSLKACMNQVIGFSSFLLANSSSFFNYKELYVAAESTGF